MKTFIEFLAIYGIAISIILYSPDKPFKAFDDLLGWVKRNMNALLHAKGKDEVPEVLKNYPKHQPEEEAEAIALQTYSYDEITGIAGIGKSDDSYFEKKTLPAGVRLKEKTLFEENLNPSLLQLHFPQKVNKSLRKAHILTLDQLLSCSSAELAGLRDIGHDTLELIEHKLQEKGLHLSYENYES
jgi:hypothetical protein